MPLDASVLLWVVGIIFLVIFLVFFVTFMFFLFRWLRAPRAYHPPVRAEDYMCPRCGSKDLELLGVRTLRCRRCGTVFTLRTAVPGGYWAVWPFFWWFPMMLFLPIVVWWTSE